MKTNVKNKTAKVKVKIFGQELEQFGITSDDKTITSDVTNYINSGYGDEETREVAEEIMSCLGRKVVGILIEDFNGNGKFFKEILDIAIITAETPELEENAKRLKRCVLPLLGRVYFPETNTKTLSSCDCKTRRMVSLFFNSIDNHTPIRNTVSQPICSTHIHQCCHLRSGQ